MSHLYRAFGLTMLSELPCPWLLPGRGPADITIRYGAVPVALGAPSASGAFYQIQAEQCLLRLEGVAGARYLVRDGQEIVIERVPGSCDDTVRLFLLGSCMGALLYQRGVLPMHGSAILSPAGAVLITGASGSGKSTLAATLVRRGFPALTDDICAISLNANGVPMACSGSPGLKLWDDALAFLEVATAQLSRVRPELPKYILPLDDGFADGVAPLTAVYILQVAPVPCLTITAVGGMTKLALLQRNAYRVEHAADLGRQALLFRSLTMLARQVDVYLVERPRHGSVVEDLADQVVRNLKV